MASVAQKPTIAVRLGQKSGQNGFASAGVVMASIAPSPSVFMMPQPSNASPIAMRNGAAHVSRNLMLSVPRTMK